MVNATPRLLYPWERDTIPIYRTLSGRVRKLSPPPGFDSQTVQLVAGQNTDYAVPAHFRFQYRRELIFVLNKAQIGSDAHPVFYTKGTGGLFLGLKRLGSEADHPSSSTAKLKNEWSYWSLPTLPSWHREKLLYR